MQLDQDGDGKVSRAEFLGWARDYAVQLKQLADAQNKLITAQQPLARGSPRSREYRRLQKELKRRQQALDRLNRKLTGYEKALRHKVDNPRR